MNQLSTKGLSLLKTLEGFRNAPYDDQTGKDTDSWVQGATIGYGHLIKKGEWDEFRDGITREEGEQLLRKDLRPFVEAVRNKTVRTLPQHQFDALVLLAFNIGRTAFSNSSALKLINNPNAQTPYQNLESAWKAWKRTQTGVSPGLINRRKREWKLFSTGAYRK
ncbi:lysozyme [Vreelandella utahensis]|uniref:lysozyme n=1 Tax=Vreelandella halophila TaxID=86177 RepID=UPI00098448B1|nr:lysozyme [Halomonas utahensis]